MDGSLHTHLLPHQPPRKAFMVARYHTIYRYSLPPVTSILYIRRALDTCALRLWDIT